MLDILPYLFHMVLVCWIHSAILTLVFMVKPKKLFEVAAKWFLMTGIVLLGSAIVCMWWTMERPPLRTLGETRLWYAFLLPLIGVLLEWRLKTQAMRIPMIFFGILFVLINVLKPEAFDQTLMPALQSVWFVPHVIVYMTAYAALGLSSGMAFYSLIKAYWQKKDPLAEEVYLSGLLIKLAVPFLTAGLCLGALWAKEAWGHYWTWDPKETWAFLTWVTYVGIIHMKDLRHGKTVWNNLHFKLWVFSLSFLVVLSCWFLLNFLPAANVSVHSYTQ